MGFRSGWDHWFRQSRWPKLDQSVGICVIVAAVTNYRKPSDFWTPQMYYLTVMEFEKPDTGLTRLKSRCQQDSVPSWRLWGRISFLDFQASRAHPCSLACCPFLSFKATRSGLILLAPISLTLLCSYLPLTVSFASPSTLTTSGLHWAHPDNSG